MVVEAAGRKFAERDDGEGGEQQCRPEGVTATQMDGDPCGEPEEGAEQQQRPGVGQQRVRGRPGQRTEEEEQQRLRQIDEARPMDLAAPGRVEAILDMVEPALPREEIVHHGETHCVIGIEDERRGARSEDGAHDEGRGDQRPADKEGPERDPAIVRHRRYSPAPGIADCR